MTKMRRLLSTIIVLGMMVTLFTGFNVNAEETVTAVYDLASSNETTVAVKFSEAVSADAVSGVTLTDCETLTAATILSVTQIDDTTVALNADGLKYGAEYKLSIPAGIMAVSGNTTVASEMYINAYNPATIVQGGVPKSEDEILFTDDFGGHEVMENPGATHTFLSKWTPGGSWLNYMKGPAIQKINNNNAMRMYHAWSTTAESLTLNPIIDKTSEGNITDGLIEIEFDLSLYTDTELCTYENFFSFLIVDGSSEYPLFNVLKTGQVEGYTTVEYTTHPAIEGCTVSVDDISKYNTFKVLLDFDLAKASLYMKYDGVYVKIHEAALGAALAANGFKTLKFQQYRAASEKAVEHASGFALDNVTITRKVNDERVLFADSFSGYTTYYTYVAGSKTSSDINSFTDTDTKWTKSGTGSWGANTYVADINGERYLKQDIWQWAEAANTLATSTPLAEPARRGVVEITFDASLNNPEDNVASGYSSYLLASMTDGAGTISPLLKIASNTLTDNSIIIYPNIGSETEKSVEYTNANGMTNLDSFKIELDYNNGKTATYILKDDTYVKLAEEAMSDAIFENGYSGLVFRYHKGRADGTVATDSCSLVDNVKVIAKDEPAVSEFEDDFSGYTAFDSSTNKSCGGEKYYVSQLANPKWIRGGWGSWGINSYIALYNGENVLKQDIFQTTAIGETNVTTTALAEASNTGVAEISFDVAVQDLNETGNNWYFVGLKDGNLGFMPMMKINKTEISVTPAVNDSYSEVIEGYTNANNLTTFNKYKVVLDFDKGTTEFFIMDGSDYVSVAKGTMNETLKERGIKQLVFGYKKGENSSGAILDTTSALLDNVKFNVTQKKVSTPVVKNVRIDGNAANNAVPTTAKKVKIAFSRTVNSKSLDGITIDGVNASGSYNKDDNTYTLTINQELNPLTTYTINVPDTVTDVEGNQLGRAYAGTFKTAKGEFTVTEFSLKEGEEAATYENTAAGDTLTAKVAIKNYALKTGEYALICAIYDGDILVKTNYVAVPYTAETLTTEKTINIVVPETTGKLKVKAMLWDVNGSVMDSAAAPIVLQ